MQFETLGEIIREVGVVLVEVGRIGTGSRGRRGRCIVVLGGYFFVSSFLSSSFKFFYRLKQG